jgi:hypothetical protein
MSEPMGRNPLKTADTNLSNYIVSHIKKRPNLKLGAETNPRTFAAIQFRICYFSIYQLQTKKIPNTKIELYLLCDKVKPCFHLKKRTQDMRNSYAILIRKPRGNRSFRDLFIDRY